MKKPKTQTVKIDARGFANKIHTDVKLAKITPYAQNYQDHSGNIEHIMASIEKFGYRKASVLVDEKWVLLAGHGVVEAHRRMGRKAIPIVVQALDLSEKAKKAYRIADNESGRGAVIIPDIVHRELAAIGADFDLRDFGLDVDALIDAVPEEQLTTPQDDQVPEVPKKPKTKAGDIYDMGKHRLICGDSTDAKVWARLMGKDQARMIFTDPPCGVSYVEIQTSADGKNWKDIAGDELRGKQLQDFLTMVFSAAAKHSVENAAFYVFHASRNQIIFETALAAAGFKVKQQLIWNKGMSLGRSDYHWAHEPLFYGSKARANCEWFGDRRGKTILTLPPREIQRLKKEQLVEILQAILDGTTVWDLQRDAVQTYMHPTQKPVALAARGIRNNSKPGELVLEPFAGSGSTLIAAEVTERGCRAIEMDPGYCDVIVERWEEKTGKKARRTR